MLLVSGDQKAGFAVFVDSGEKVTPRSSSNSSVYSSPFLTAR